MSPSTPYPARVEFHGDCQITRWHPLVQWFLAIPQLVVASALRTLRQVLLVISLFTVLFTERIPRPIFDMIVTTYRYEWRTLSYAAFLHEDYPPFDFEPMAVDNDLEPHTTLSVAYPDRLNRWKPLYKWILALPHYLVVAALLVGAVLVVLAALVMVIATGEYPAALRDYLVGTYRYTLRVEAYVGLLTDTYPPFALNA